MFPNYIAEYSNSVQLFAHRLELERTSAQLDHDCENELLVCTDIDQDLRIFLIRFMLSE